MTNSSNPINTRSTVVDLVRHPLRDVVNDTKSRPFCGPMAVAAITGEPISRVRDAFRLVRHGEGWIHCKRAPAIMGTLTYEVERVLSIFGYVGSWRVVDDQPTLAAWLEARAGVERTHPLVVQVTGHWIALSGWEFCDTRSRGRVVDAEEAPGRRKRVRRVFVITERCTPAAEIPTKTRTNMSVPNLKDRDVLAANAAMARDRREIAGIASSGAPSSRIPL
ncbi:hypothetical protein [uncultured Agrobacterium sp.]|uniref:hypothetical protein n=1 Tax=uncultured Agrobacterium sp. TaxID=157277 RepID=UPI0025DC2444|nr:hypothetical protein [uncultured Agrobacterium sp.]